MKKAFAVGVVVFVLWLMLAFVFHWMVNRYEVPDGYSLQLRYKGVFLLGFNKSAKAGHWAEEGQVGVLQKLRGPGRHFYSPIWWERKLVKDIVIKPGEVGIVTCKLGDSLPDGEFLVDGDMGKTEYKGVLRKCLSPGRYRVNPYGYQVDVLKTQIKRTGNTDKISGWVNIPTGFVGVVTNLADNKITNQKAGIQDKVLPPGIYPVNPKEQQIDIVGIGYWETSVGLEKVKTEEQKVQYDESGEPLVASMKGGINFPSSDGFPITMEFTSVWGLMPEQCPNAIRVFGNVEAIENKVILPQIESICRNNGSEYSATNLLVGEDRERFQKNTLEEFQDVLKEKQIDLMYALVRHIYIPKEVRAPIQASFIADELKLTREQEILTAQENAKLKEAKKKVELATATVTSQTEKMIAKRKAEGEKLKGETEAETEKLVAAVKAETAKLLADASLVIGEAENEGKSLIEKAKANKFALAVEAFGTPQAYNNWTFAQGLPDKIEIRTIYAGPGTMWTDLKEAVRIMATPDKAVKK